MTLIVGKWHAIPPQIGVLFSHAWSDEGLYPTIRFFFWRRSIMFGLNIRRRLWAS